MINPGSKEAIKIGCICPVIDNHYGEDIDENVNLFWYNYDCPVHSNIEKQLPMVCPKCKSESEDYDGLGVIFL